MIRRPPHITFSAPTHTYRVDGRVVPGITSILVAAGLIDDRWYTSESCERGTAVHRATADYDQHGTLTEPYFGLTGYLNAWRTFRAAACPDARRIIGIEVPCYNALHDYCTHLDRLLLTVDGDLCVCNIKTGAKAYWHAIQLAAEAACIPEPCRRWSVYLRADGTFRLVEHRNLSDLPRFLAARQTARERMVDVDDSISATC